ncbi:MAG: HAMP domain-containing histidine kinase [Lachnospiraceae bacterium]|nr:HAMP domain-containing histidine kinase [Lachnospiraceae bacterium]
MKLFWKQFTAIVCLMVTLFAVFGSIFLQTTFRIMLEREKERGLEEWKMFQFALLASMEALPEEYSIENDIMTEMTETIEDSIGSQENGIAIYNADRQLIYKNGMFYGALMAENIQTDRGLWRLSDTEDGHYLEALSRLESNDGTYYLAFGRNIQYVYDARDRLYEQYRNGVLFVIVLSIPVSWLLAYHFTKPIRQLAKATRDFARGNYQSRVEVKGEDELAGLMMEFNRMARRLERSIWQLEDAARRQEEFTGAFAHELKTPLTSIIGYGDMLRSMNLTEEEKRSSSDYIYQQGKRLERLSYKMMELVRVNNQGITLKPMKTREVAYEVELFTKRLLWEKKVTLEKSIAPGIIFGDLDLLCSLFGNLIDNAAKACARKTYTGEEQGKILFVGKQEKRGYSFTIMDNGCGIPADEVGKITEAFYMVDKSRARKEGGAGIGMTLCSRIVKLHHAHWEIASNENEGTNVYVFFPEEEEEDD